MSATTSAPAAAPAEDDRRKRAAWRPLAAAAAAGSVLVITGFGVWASLNATATGVQSIDSGTLKLALADKGVGFSQNLANLAPGDSVARFVTLTNTGTLEGRSLTLKVAATGSDALVTDAGARKAARMTVENCTSAWVGGNCAPGASTLVGPVALSTLATANALSNVSSVASLGALNLKITVALPDQTETSVNGVLPTTTIQGATAQLNYTFAETQRDATATTDPTA
jgi:hypothetical protein